MLQDKMATMQVLAGLIKQPSLLHETDKYQFTNEDFPERFHMIIFATINNLYRNGTEEIDEIAIDGFLSKYDVQHKIFTDNDGVEYIQNIKEIGNLNNFDYYYTKLKKYSFLRACQQQGIDITDIYDENLLNPKEQEEMQRQFDQYSLQDIMKIVDKKIVDIKEQFKTNSESKGIQGGEGLKDLIEELKQNPEYGAPLCSGILTTVCRGARLKKFYIRSAPSGFGKSRTALADILNLAVDEIYDIDKKQWVSNGEKERSLFITTELDFSEIQSMAVAFVSGVSESKILDAELNEDEEARVIKAIEVIESSYFWIEHLPDFNVEDIERVIEKNIINNDVQYVAFDYIHSSMKLLNEITSKSNVSLREDQVLLLLSDKLKGICNKYNVFLLSGTQLNSEWKNTVNQDANAIRGSKAIIDKTDVAMISLPVTKQDLEALEPILKSGFYKTPNIVVNVFKNRRGQYNNVKVWQYVDLGNLRTKDCFMTNSLYELVKIESTKIQYKEEKTKKQIDF